MSNKSKDELMKEGRHSREKARSEQRRGGVKALWVQAGARDLFVYLILRTTANQRIPYDQIQSDRWESVVENRFSR